MQKTFEFVRTGNWYELKRLNDTNVDMLELQSIRNVQDELAVYSDYVLLKDGRLILSKSLRECA